LSPLTLGFALDRSEEMIVGVGLPFLLLLIYELFVHANPDEIKRESPEVAPDSLVASAGEVQNLFGLKVLSLWMVAIGGVFLILTFWAGDAAIYLSVLGLIITAFGGLLYRYAAKNIKVQKVN